MSVPAANHFLLIAILAWLAAPPIAEGAVVIQSGLTPTPPTIDGQIEAGEWAASGQLLFSSTSNPPYDIEHRILVMNDEDNLYLAVLRVDTTPGTGHDSLTVNFDNQLDGVVGDGDDRFGIWVDASSALPGTFNDWFYSGISPISDDGSQYGGTIDGAGAAGADENLIIFEFSHPLDSGDTGYLDWQQTRTGQHDFALQPGDAVGFNIDSYDQSHDLGSWPAPSPVGDASGYGEIHLAPEPGEATSLLASFTALCALRCTRRKLPRSHQQ